MSQCHDRRVALKVLRVPSSSDVERISGVGRTRLVCVDELTYPVQRFCKDVLTWKSLRHPNVLPLMGVTMASNQLAMVSEWMENGNINQFVKACADVDRLKLVCRLSFQILVFDCH